MSATVSQAGSKITAQLINPLLESVRETFETMLECPISRDGLELRHDGWRHDLTAVISISGRVKGKIGISFQQQTALGVVQRFTGSRPNRINDEVIDAVGEMANLIGGGAKSKLNMALNIGLPRVTRSDDTRDEFPVESRPMRVHFDSELGPFCVDFGFVVRRL